MQPAEGSALEGSLPRLIYCLGGQETGGGGFSYRAQDIDFTSPLRLIFIWRREN